MAAFSLFQYRGPSPSLLFSNPSKRGPRPRRLSMTAVTCRGTLPDDEEEKGDKGQEVKGSRGLATSLLKLGEGLRGSLTPQRKGDWKDLTLISLSFSLYIYISQKLVCAYSAWISSTYSTPHW
ncbi:hypothetical protein MLD38_003607 [Melastoma candidum]|uniref:Uncharacterized protein n=1 Tax=Melastoma candidum TaxID=119954 RepID=A0ACB9S344_9MYRT|nr:hypothetical protein MLD38_003607 [Melastoma candidum]